MEFRRPAEMKLVERSSLLETVADALETSAYEAEEQCDAAFLQNAMCIASTIRGMAGNLGADGLAAVSGAWSG
ncbi:hypothetical protein [Rhizobium sp. S163]|uniref:hypothetical protein n=1 Tax=Rhizobium sp. S163 TaxID=3055039 RepID=UPI0025A93F9B|nr:hypothetical protein [Rhizobium sp. S163]MDM9649100.1 hypothetical protein [Rhizobium sp. S163]